MPEYTREQLENLIRDFSDGFDRDDLDFVMKHFTEDATYVEFNGKTNRGKAAIREAFEPQFRGDFGKMRFEKKELFVDVEFGKAFFGWWCTIENEGKIQKGDGLDVFHFEGGLIKEKRSYFLCDIPKFDFVDG